MKYKVKLARILTGLDGIFITERQLGIASDKPVLVGDVIAYSLALLIPRKDVSVADIYELAQKIYNYTAAALKEPTQELELTPEEYQMIGNAVAENPTYKPVLVMGQVMKCLKEAVMVEDENLTT